MLEVSELKKGFEAWLSSGQCDRTMGGPKDALDTKDLKVRE